MTSLQGSFELIGFGELANLLATKGETGRLHVRARNVGADLYLADGAFVGITLADEPAPASARVARQRLEEVCFELLGADRGTFEFHPGQGGRPAATLSVKVDTVLSAAQHREDEWREVREAIPSLDLRPQVSDELGEPEITLDRHRWELLVAIDGRRTVHAIARKLRLTEFDTCRLLKTLIDDGAVVLPELEKRRATRSASPDDHTERKPPLRISSKGAVGVDDEAPSRRVAANATASPTSGTKDDAKTAEKGAAASAADDGEVKEAKRSRLPTVARLRRSRPEE